MDFKILSFRKLHFENLKTWQKMSKTYCDKLIVNFNELNSQMIVDKLLK